MIVRDLNEVDRQIAETRTQIKCQRWTVHNFEKEGQTADAVQAGVLLKVLEDSLTTLLERRRNILQQLRRPRASSRPQIAERPKRRSGKS
jgi:hypothetical protein